MIQFKIADLPDQQFSAILERCRVTMRLRYNITSDRWNLDLSIDDLPVLNGRRIVTGVDLLKPFGLGVGVLFAAAVNPSVDAVPDRTKFVDGTVKLFQTTDAEIELTEDPAPVAAIITRNERPIWTAPAPIYFGSEFQIGREIDNIENGFAINFVDNELLIRSNVAPALNYFGTVDTAIADGQITFARASPATRFNSFGLIETVADDVWRVQHDPLTGAPLGFLCEPAAVNLQPNSSLATTLQNVTAISDSVTAPDGSLTGDQIIENTAAGVTHYLDHQRSGFSIDDKVVFSAFVKMPDNPRKLQMAFATAADGNSQFDPVTGEFYDGVAYTGRGIEKLKNGWSRIWIADTVTVAATLVSRLLLIDNSLNQSYTGDGFSGMTVWGRQLEFGVKPSSHIPTTGTDGARAADDMRIDLASFPYLDGMGELFINGVEVVPVIVGTDLVIAAAEPIKIISWRAST